MAPIDPPPRRYVLDDHTDPGLVDEVSRLARVQAHFEERMDRLQDDHTMIDPKEFGRMQSDVQGLRRDFDAMNGTLSGILKEMREMNSQMSEAKGGWKMLMMVGAAAGMAGAGLVKFFMWLAELGPKG